MTSAAQNLLGMKIAAEMGYPVLTLTRTLTRTLNLALTLALTLTLI